MIDQCTGLDPTRLATWARSAAPACRYWSVRVVAEHRESIHVRQNIVQAPNTVCDMGLMAMVVTDDGFAYSATSDVTETGLSRAFQSALEMARAMGNRFGVDLSRLDLPSPDGCYQTPVGEPIPESLAERIAVVADAAAAIKTDDRICDWSANLSVTNSEQIYLTSGGGCVAQKFQFVEPGLKAVAQHNGQSQTRTVAGQYNGFCQQGGFEVLQRAGFMTAGERIADEAVALTMAPNCPDETMALLLMPDQMMLQIHESIGHPLELDRILGDERNFAGTSFVNLDMFGSYRYGSNLLNVSHDPGVAGELASFAYDDDGSAASRQMLIKDGILVQPLGGFVSAARARDIGYHFDTVATTRACSWNRAPIDRMSNLNVEPGDSSLQDMVAAVDNGILMQTNCSWSIDDSRNKFQFGCEYGRRIKNGRLTDLVRNPNYRGVSANFWRSLKMVGDQSTVDVMGTPYCGKGEPMQIIRVGHASPACLFDDVAVFGGDR